MDKRIERIAESVGAKYRGRLPATGGGAFGMARIAQLLYERLAGPVRGSGPGARTTNDQWTEHRKVPLSAETLANLQELSVRLSSDERKVSPMQLAAQLLEECVVKVAAGGATSPRRKTDKRAQRGSRRKFDRALSKANNVAPENYDRISDREPASE